MSTKKKGFIFILAIEALVIAGLIIFLFYISNDTVRAKHQLELAQHYLLEEDYEQAIAVFNTVIEIDPKNEDAYIGLAQAYAESGNLEEAVKTLEKGYKETNAEGIYELKVIQTEELAQREAQKQEETALTTDMESQPESTETETIDTASSENTVQTGFVTQDGELYYYDEQGNIVTGWFDVNSNRYCARQDGKLYKADKYEIDGSNYLFGQDGICFGEIKNDAWKQAYLDKIQQYQAQIPDIIFWGYALIYVDNDDIPELVICFEESSEVFSYSNSNGIVTQPILDEEALGPIMVSSYMERQGLILIGGGDESSWDGVYSLADGKWTQIAYGCITCIYSDGIDYWSYSWNGTEVAEEQQYNAAMNSVYNEANATDLYYGWHWHTYEEIADILKN